MRVVCIVYTSMSLCALVPNHVCVCMSVYLLVCSLVCVRLSAWLMQLLGTWLSILLHIEIVKLHNLIVCLKFAFGCRPVPE